MADWVLSVFIVAGAVIYLRAAMNLERLQVGDVLGPQVFPVLVAICMLCSGLLLAWETWRKQATAENQPSSPGTAVVAGPPAWHRHLVLVAMAARTALYYVAFEPAGYIVSTTIYLSALLFYFHRVNPLINIAYATAFTGAAYLLFTHFLQVVLPSGILQLGAGG